MGTKSDFSRLSTEAVRAYRKEAKEMLDFFAKSPASLKDFLKEGGKKEDWRKEKKHAVKWYNAVLKDHDQELKRRRKGGK